MAGGSLNVAGLPEIIRLFLDIEFSVKGDTDFKDELSS